MQNPCIIILLKKILKMCRHTHTQDDYCNPQYNNILAVIWNNYFSCHYIIKLLLFINVLIMMNTLQLTSQGPSMQSK